MAKVTKAKILKETETIEKYFTDMEDELLLNIARAIEGGDFSMAKQLAKIGKLTEENIEIISKYNKKWEKEIRKCLEEIAKYATKDVDKQFKEAEGKGEIKPPEVPDEIYNATIDGFTAQTIDKLKAMNGTILASSLEQYQKAVYEIEQAKQKIAAEWLDREVRYDEMAEAAQSIYIQGQATMRASAEAIRKLNQEGITGFIDRAGRHWNADTYAAMVTRTNAHSLSIESVKARQEEYGSDIFQISSHGGSRELCYPYQGKLYSWTAATGGTFKDGAGVKQQYGSLINDTSYGEPAGIFGINCGHYPMPIIPGVSIVHEQPIQPKEENDKEYAESQKQRYLERQIREAKREYEMLKASGADEQTLKEAKERIGEKQKNMRGFIDETGRTRRYDREKLFFENSGNYKPTMSKIKEEKPETKTVETNQKETPKNYEFNNLGGNIGKLEKNVYNDSREIIANYINKYPELKDNISLVGSHQERNKALKKELYPEFLKELKKMNPNIPDARLEAFAKKSVNRAVGIIGQNTYAAACYAGSSKMGYLADILKKYSGIVLNEKQFSNLETFNKKYSNDIKLGWHPKTTSTNYLKQLIDHEVGHQLDRLIDFRNDKEFISYFMTLKEKDIIDGLSQYPVSSRGLDFRKAELIAEAWSEYQNNDNPREIAKIVGEMLERKLKNR